MIFTQEIQLGEVAIIIEAHTSASMIPLNALAPSFEHFAPQGNARITSRIIIAIGSEQHVHHLPSASPAIQPYLSEWVYAPKHGIMSDAHKILGCIEGIVVSYYAERGAILLHAASAVYRDSGFLFLGQSGAGKTTTVRNLHSIGIPILGEDRVLLIPSAQDGYILAKAPTFPPQLMTVPEARPTLRAVFVLIQDKMDHIVPISQTHTANMIFQAFQEQSASRVLTPPMLPNAFHTASQVARQVQGYDLHLRNSPDFWKLIDAEFFS